VGLVALAKQGPAGGNSHVTKCRSSSVPEAMSGTCGHCSSKLMVVVEWQVMTSYWCSTVNLGQWKPLWSYKPLSQQKCNRSKKSKKNVAGHLYYHFCNAAMQQIQSVLREKTTA